MYINFSRWLTLLAMSIVAAMVAVWGCAAERERTEVSRAERPPTTTSSITIISSVAPRWEAEFDHTLGIMTIPATVGLTKGIFLVDTGASLCVIDRRFFRETNPTTKSVDDPSRGRVILTYSDPPELTVGPFKLGGSGRCLFGDLENVSKRFSQNVMGVIGLPILKHFVVSVSPDGSRFIISDRVLQSDVNKFDHYEIDYNYYGIPVVVMEIDGTKCACAIDSGCDHFAALTEWQFAPALYKRGINATTIPLFAYGLQYTSRRVILPTVSVAGVEFSRATVSEQRSDVCLLGIGFLRKSRAVLDFPSGELLVPVKAAGGTGERGDEAERGLSSHR